MYEGRGADTEGRVGVAEGFYRAALRLEEASADRDPRAYAETVLALASTLIRVCRLQEASAVLTPGESLMGPTAAGTDLLAARFAMSKALIAAYGGDFAAARTAAERALRSASAIPGALPELGVFIADVAEDQGDFDAAAKWDETVLSRMPSGPAEGEPSLPFFYPGGVALRLHHAYAIAGRSADARALEQRYTIVTARAGGAWLPVSDWKAGNGVCDGFPKGLKITDSFEDTPGLLEQFEHCVGPGRHEGLRVLVNLLFSPQGKVIAAAGAAINLDRDRLECACRSTLQATLPSVGYGYRSRHLEAQETSINRDNRGM